MSQANQNTAAKKYPIRHVIMQFSPHLDSIAAFFMLVSDGEGQYPGVATATVSCWGGGSQLVEGKTWQQHLAEGTLLIGVGSGPFDEHPSEEFGDRKSKGESSTSLVAKHLGLHETPAYRKLVERVTKSDLQVETKDELKESGAHYKLSEIINEMHDVGDNLQHVVIPTVFILLRAIVRAQLQFHEAKSEAKAAMKRFIPNTNLSVVCLKSNNPKIWAATRTVWNKGLAALVLQRPSGNIQIFLNQQVGATLGEIPRRLRELELVALDRATEIGQHQDTLGQLGMHPAVPEWYVQDNMALNGSKTSRKVKPTKIEPNTILQTVIRYIDFVQVPATVE